MNNLFKTIALMLICSQVFANSIDQETNNIVYNYNSPQEYMAQNTNKDYWFAYSVPVQTNTRSNCCWNDNVNSEYKTQECDLNKNINSFGTSDKSLITKRNNIFIQVKDNNVSNIIPVGESCKIKADGMKIAWLQDAIELKSIDFLKHLSLNSSDKVANNALYAMSMHKNNQASKELYQIAMLNKHDRSTNAVFWLGESRNDGVHYLSKLYKSLPKGDTKKHINFALSQSEDATGLKFLKEIAVNDKNKAQRSDALFWLAEKDPISTKQIIIESLKNDSAEDIEHSVFTLSRLADNQGDESLFELLSGNYTNKVKKKALFWLSQSDNTETLNKLAALIN
jgi:hypothetical protein